MKGGEELPAYWRLQARILLIDRSNAVPQAVSSNA